MAELDDFGLLQEFAASGSEKAFETLVTRHVNLVYSAALRVTRNSHQAEEVAQVVFIILARKAGRIRGGTVVSGWLYQTARLTASNLVRGEIRRQHREQEAQMQVNSNEVDEKSWEQIAPLLDEALGHLGEADRNAVILRFFENKTAAEVATALKMSEAAANKRWRRALEKLQKFFTKRGVALPTGVLAAAIAANSVQAAPVGLNATITGLAVKGVSLSSSTLILMKGALKVMAWAKLKTAIVVGSVFLLAAGTTTLAVKSFQPDPQQPQRAHAGRTRMELSGTEGAVVTGFYIQNGQRVALSNAVPWSFTGSNVSAFEFRKTNPEHLVIVNLSYQSKEARAQVAKPLDKSFAWMEGKVQHGFVTVTHPR